MKTACANCEASAKDFWVMFGSHRKPKVSKVIDGNWISLERCDNCGALWCEAPYEPYASFPYLVAWPHEQASWQRLHDLDDGRALLAWHAYEVAARWRSLSKDEQDEVEAHRKRSYGHNPIDNPAVFKAAPINLKTEADGSC